MRLSEKTKMDEQTILALLNDLEKYGLMHLNAHNLLVAINLFRNNLGIVDRGADMKAAYARIFKMYSTEFAGHKNYYNSLVENGVLTQFIVLPENAGQNREFILSLYSGDYRFA